MESRMVFRDQHLRQEGWRSRIGQRERSSKTLEASGTQHGALEQVLPPGLVPLRLKWTDLYTPQSLSHGWDCPRKGTALRKEALCP